MFNECLFHLCDCTCSNVMYILNCLLIKPKKIFEYFICFWKCFCVFRVLFKQSISFLLKKALSEAFLWVNPTRKDEDGKILENTEIQIESFAISLRERATCENYLYATVTISRVTLREAYPQNARFCNFWSQTVIVFSNLFILPPLHLSQPKTKTHPKLKINPS